MPSIHVISPAAGFGNRLDLELVAGLLERAGFDVVRTPVIRRGKSARFQRLGAVMLKRWRRFDINLFLAPIFPEWLPFARKNILIPNAEGFPPHLHRYLPKIDLVLAKTRLTERVFRTLGCKAEYVGFVSKDQLDEQVPRDPARFFHACSSQYKGTRRLIDTWRRHPEWPELVTVINHNDTVQTEIDAANIRAIRGPVSDAQIREFQNSFSCHLCTSEAEGFGHYIMESMSCRAVVFTTDGPPMNELVQPDRGVLLDALDDRPPMGLSHRYFFRAESLEMQMDRVLKMDSTVLGRMGSNARAYFLKANQFFQETFPELMRTLCRR